MTTTTDPAEAATAPFALSPQQVAFFQTFGFLRLPGLLRDRVAAYTKAFEEVFAANDAVVLPPNPYHRVRDPRFEQEPRFTIPYFVEQHPVLTEMLTDPRITGIAASLLGPDFEYAQSDGNLFYCDVYWHFDAFGSPIDQQHIKMYVYLDALRHDTGALRVLSGTGDLGGSYVATLRKLFMDPDQAEATLGVALEDLPSWTLETDPGDLIVGNYRTLHATFGGGPRRRLFTVNFREPAPSADS